MSGIEVIAVVVFVGLVYGFVVLKERRLANPLNTSAIYIEQMRANHRLRSGPVAVKLYRQSGNEYRDLGVFEAAESAFTEVMKSFRRAGIDSVAVLQNDGTRYEVARLHHSHRGKAEGKKLGGALIFII